MYIYVIRNSVTGKVYIGQHKGTNLRQYLQKKFYDAAHNRGGSSHLYASMRKHPREVWSIEPLIDDIETKADLDRWERALIALYDTRNPDIGYNICRGGEGFTGTHSDEWKENMSQTMKAKGQKPTEAATDKSIDVRRQILANTGLWPGALTKDMVDDVVNGVTVLSRLKNQADGAVVWNCRCHCGGIFPATGHALRNGHTMSCGCLKLEQDKLNLYRRPVTDMTGLVANGVKVLQRLPDVAVGSPGKVRNRVMWLCLCHCGRKFPARGENLRSGHTKGCGCMRGRSRKSPTYSLVEAA